MLKTRIIYKLVKKKLTMKERKNMVHEGKQNNIKFSLVLIFFFLYRRTSEDTKWIFIFHFFGSFWERQSRPQRHNVSEKKKKNWSDQSSFLPMDFEVWWALMPTSDGKSYPSIWKAHKIPWDWALLCTPVDICVNCYLGLFIWRHVKNLNVKRR